MFTKEQRKAISKRKKQWHKDHPNRGRTHWQKFWDTHPKRKKWAAKRITKLNRTPEARKRSGNIFRNLWKNNPEFAAKVIKTARNLMKGFNGNPEFQEKRLEGISRSVDSGTSSKRAKAVWDSFSVEQQKRLVRNLRKGISPSKTQLALYFRLRKLGIRGLALEWKVGVGIYSLDIAHLPTKTDIESDGSYWHTNVEKDERRDLFLRKKGWRIVRIPVGRPEKVKKLDLIPLLQVLKRAA